jgi:predicted cupin superfamily sugar epimerase
MESAADWIGHLQLLPHPEGGFYKEVFRSEINVVRPSLPELKKACTSIYYLLEGADHSGFHRLASDEIWYFHKGEPLTIHVIHPDGTYAAHELSDRPDGSLSIAIEAGLWFAADLPSGVGFTLASCAVAPGFELSEFEMADKDALTALYPRHAALISKLCRSHKT